MNGNKMLASCNYGSFSIEAEVDIMPDMYGTGDSPTGYEVEVSSCFNNEEGKEIDFNSLSGKVQGEIENLLIEEVRGL